MNLSLKNNDVHIYVSIYTKKKEFFRRMSVNVVLIGMMGFASYYCPPTPLQEKMYYFLYHVQKKEFFRGCGRVDVI